MVAPELARAADPRTPPHEVDELAAQGAPDVRAAVARNPNAPAGGREAPAASADPDLRGIVARAPERTSPRGAERA